MRIIIIYLLFIAMAFTGVTQDNHSFDVKKIDSIQYFALKQKSDFQKSNIEKITDLDHAKKLLDKRIKWGQYDENSIKFVEDKDSNAVLEITFGNGDKYVYDYAEAYFVSYYPQEDILLLEGGHCSDISFNLTTGEETEDVGNPECFSPSPSGRYRLNGYLSGQESNYYFIEEKTNDRYSKIIQICSPYIDMTDFEKRTGVALYYISDAFWQNDTILNVETLGLDDDINLYYQISINR